MSTAAGLVLDVAAREVGAHEEGGNNRGPAVARYMSAVGQGEGGAWCAGFVAWCLQRAEVQGWPCTGWVPNIEAWAREHGILRTTPSPGDVFLLCDAQGPYHTGLVERCRGGMVDTIEGNTGGGSDADGDGVYRKSRPVEACRFVHWQELLAPPASPKRVKLFWHDGHGAFVDPDGKTHQLRGVKVNGQPWAGGEIVAGLE